MKGKSVLIGLFVVLALVFCFILPGCDSGGDSDAASPAGTGSGSDPVGSDPVGSDPSGSDPGNSNLGNSFVGTWKGTDYDGEPLTLTLSQDLIFKLIFEWGKTPTLTGSFKISGNTITLYVPGETMSGTIDGIKIYIKGVNFTKTNNGTGGDNPGSSNPGGSDPGGSDPGASDPGGSDPGNSTPSTPSSFTVSNAAEWNSAVNAINAGGNDKAYTINVTGDVIGDIYTGSPYNTFSPTGLMVNIKGNSGFPNIRCSGLVIKSNQDITIQDINLICSGYTTISDGGHFTMQNASIKGSSSTISSGVRLRGGKFTMNGGTISNTGPGSTTGPSDFLSAVSIIGGTFTMNSGTISEIRRTGGVSVDGGGTFNMKGGVISGNHGCNIAWDFIYAVGGGVAVIDGTFNMSGGTISNNDAIDGGGVYLDDEGATFNMSGGTISGNIANRSGGGVHLYDGTFNMSGGTISGNSLKNSGYGGGVYICGGSFTMSGGKISGNTALGYTQDPFSSIHQYGGGGVYVDNNYFTSHPIFSKTGGTITGYSDDPTNGNVVKDHVGIIQNALGHAVYCYFDKSNQKRKESTAWPNDNLSFNGNDGTFSGAWDY